MGEIRSIVLLVGHLPAEKTNNMLQQHVLASTCRAKMVKVGAVKNLWRKLVLLSFHLLNVKPKEACVSLNLKKCTCP